MISRVLMCCVNYSFTRENTILSIPRVAKNFITANRARGKENYLFSRVRRCRYSGYVTRGKCFLDFSRVEKNCMCTSDTREKEFLANPRDMESNRSKDNTREMGNSLFSRAMRF